MLKKRMRLAAISQIFIIIFAVFSFAFLIGEFDFVSGQPHSYTPVRGAEGFFVKQETGELVKFIDGKWVSQGYYDPSASVTGTGSKSSGFFSDLYGGTAFGAKVGTLPSALLQGVAWGGTVYLALTLLTSLLGVEEGLADAISAAGGSGFFCWVGRYK